MNSKNTESRTAFLEPIISPIFNPKVLKQFKKKSEDGIKKYVSFGIIEGFP